MVGHEIIIVIYFLILVYFLPVNLNTKNLGTRINNFHFQDGGVVISFIMLINLLFSVQITSASIDCRNMFLFI